MYLCTSYERLTTIKRATTSGREFSGLQRLACSSRQIIVDKCSNGKKKFDKKRKERIQVSRGAEKFGRSAVAGSNRLIYGVDWAIDNFYFNDKLIDLNRT